MVVLVGGGAVSNGRCNPVLVPKTNATISDRFRAKSVDVLSCLCHVSSTEAGFRVQGAGCRVQGAGCREGYLTTAPGWRRAR
jgi:hypothetical protein